MGSRGTRAIEPLEPAKAKLSLPVRPLAPAVPKITLLPLLSTVRTALVLAESWTWKAVVEAEVVLARTLPLKVVPALKVWLVVKVWPPALSVRATSLFNLALSRVPDEIELALRLVRLAPDTAGS